MKNLLSLKLFLIISSFIFSSLIVAYGEENDDPATHQNKVKSNNTVRSQTQSFNYIPPATKKLRPEVRVATGGVRGDADCHNMPTITLLVPNHVAYTANSQPELFFHSTDQLNSPVKLTIQESKSIKPALSVNLQDKVSRGINRIKLSDYNFSFENNHEYQWSLEITGIVQSSTCNSIARAIVKMKSFYLETNNNYVTGNNFIMSDLYAKNGFWYDALEIFILQMLDVHYNKQQLISILNQIELTLKL